jgi:hypothetical protein
LTQKELLFFVFRWCENRFVGKAKERKAMKTEKIVEVLSAYRKELAGVGIGSCQLENYDEIPEEEVALRHITWMCEQAIEFAETGRLEKANRWLGFIQGTLWLTGRHAVSSMREHNRPRCPHCHGPEDECNDLRGNRLYCKNTDMCIRNNNAE